MMTTTSKIYLVTRSDLSYGQRAVQAAHSLHEFMETNRGVYDSWVRQSRTLAILEASDEKALSDISERARVRGVPLAEFHEPDCGMELTAVALGPTGKGLVRRLPLAFS